MNNNLKVWMGQVTTGHGAMIIAPTLLAVAAGALSWHVALPLLLAGVAGLLWPESGGGGAAAPTPGVDAIVAAYRMGLQHAATAPDPAAASATPSPTSTAVSAPDVQNPWMAE